MSTLSVNGPAFSRRGSVATSVSDAVDALARFLTRWSVPALRVALGLVFLGFGALKFFPGASPAEVVAERTIDTLTLGLVHGTVAVVLTAVVECFIGLTLVTGYWLRAGLVVMAGAFVGILAPTALFFDELFGSGMTLLGQYVLKDVVLVAAAAVVGAYALGARLRRTA
ncbi:DoxX family membrane protein [Oerskovia sp. Sa1BUA8]|uniref:DoxX family membrane protein n=1 Tax=Oerskovia douganii TaxID=2762210 RepID=A0A9D5YYN5_9CELL|nr:DoxX family membrane protein [Oerskovia douganii]MBE7700102.1 DoxX family membrane protein [Oerskovia douganii]